nr:hypothetical protein [Candidatus Sigynarchaeota archaeon]
MFKEKAAGFKYLFSDKEIRGSAIASFFVAILLVSVEYIHTLIPNVFVYIIAIGAFSTFQYLAMVFILFNVWRVFGAFRGDSKRSHDKANLWVIRIITGITILSIDLYLFNIGLTAAAPFLVLAFISWCILEAFFLAMFAAELASYARRVGFRFLLYLIFTGIFGAYLIFQFWSAVIAGPMIIPATIVFGLDATWFDWLFTLVLFVFSFASMGQRFLPPGPVEKLDFKRISGKQGAKIRSTVLFLLFSLVGFQIIVRGFDFLKNVTPIPQFGSVLYYGVKLFFFVPFAIGFLVVVIVKRIGKYAGKKKSNAKK